VALCQTSELVSAARDETALNARHSPTQTHPNWRNLIINLMDVLSVWLVKTFITARKHGKISAARP
jgi:hypothetical protein